MHVAETTQNKIARDLMSIALHLGYMHRRVEALETIEQAVSMCKALSAVDPAAFMLDLAKASHEPK